MAREASKGASWAHGAASRRWLMLALFAATSAANAAHWLQFAIIANTAQRFYGVDAVAINWTSMIFMAAYVPLVFPASWITEKKGLRVAVALGAGLTAAGGWLKAGAASPNRFALAFAGQTLVGAAQMFTLGAPARLAALWFPPGQVATACALGVFGNQVGIAVGFVVPSAVVSADGDEASIAHQLLALHVALAAVPTLLFLLIVCLFEAAPPAPSAAEVPDVPEALPLRPPAGGDKVDRCLPESPGAVAGAGAGAEVPAPTFTASLRRLARNRDFALLWLAYGLNVGVFYAVSTLLGQMVLLHFAGAMASRHAGRVGLVMVAAGVAGSVAGGLALDRWHRFKETTLAVYAMALAGMLAFAFALHSGAIALVYATAAFLGFFMTGYLGVGYEYAAALTWPVAESTSSGMLNASSEIFGMALTLAAGELLEAVGDRLTNLALTAALGLGFVLSAFVRGRDLRRAPAPAVVQPLAPLPTPVKFLS